MDSNEILQPKYELDKIIKYNSEEFAKKVRSEARKEMNRRLMVLRRDLDYNTHYSKTLETLKESYNYAINEELYFLSKEDKKQYLIDVESLIDDYTKTKGYKKAEKNAKYVERFWAYVVKEAKTFTNNEE